MRARERRQRQRRPEDPIATEREALVTALAAGNTDRHGPLCAILAAYAARARALRIELDALVAEFRSVFDRTIPRDPADFGHALRRERLVTELMAAFRTAALR